MIPAALLAAMRSAAHTVVFTGAGVSAESGIPTFRDALTGLWERFDPTALATPDAFRRDPALVWGWYEWRRMRVLQAQPNPAHLAIAELARHVPRLTLITQNVDDLHERAGSREVIHLHGSLHAPRCFACSRPAAAPLPAANEPDAGRRVEPPRCGHCGGRLRPGVVWFGENLPVAALNAAFQAAGECDLLLAVGTSGVVYPAADVPRVARDAGATVIHINPQGEPPLSEREHLLALPAGEVLPLLVSEAFAAR
ncbi:NAD-dependent protein deacylase [Pseudomonas stutzeri]|uniref:NAD-dependent protein deacylase n=1 Tax=Stutzerimonas stutzeri TaxID=316 RepID=UPI00190A268C|nr:NAD-dependent protein deacylase [Stutzerimonas stutzeri]